MKRSNSLEENRISFLICLRRGFAIALRFRPASSRGLWARRLVQIRIGIFCRNVFLRRLSPSWLLLLGALPQRLLVLLVGGGGGGPLVLLLLLLDRLQDLGHLRVRAFVDCWRRARSLAQPGHGDYFCKGLWLKGFEAFTFSHHQAAEQLPGWLSSSSDAESSQPLAPRVQKIRCGAL